jgi:hypothetical protein
VDSQLAWKRSRGRYASPLRGLLLSGSGRPLADAFSCDIVRRDCRRPALLTSPKLERRPARLGAIALLRALARAGRSDWRRCDRPDRAARARQRACGFAHTQESPTAASDDPFPLPAAARLVIALATYVRLHFGRQRRKRTASEMVRLTRYVKYVLDVNDVNPMILRTERADALHVRLRTRTGSGSPLHRRGIRDLRARRGGCSRDLDRAAC